MTDTADVVRVKKKIRVEEGPDGHCSKDAFYEVEAEGPGRVSDDMADYLWHEIGVEPEDHGLEVQEQ